MRPFRLIEINCFNIFRFLADVSTNLQKMHYFGQFRDHNLGKKKGNYTNNPIFFINFLSSNCLWCSFLYLKIAKLHFMGSFFRPFWSAKYLNFGGVSWKIRILFRLIQETYTLRKVKNQVLIFYSSWEPNLSDVMVHFCLFQNAILHRVEAQVLNL